MFSGAIVAGGPAQAATSASFGELFGAHCTSAVNCWAVGIRNNGTATLNEVLHYTGKKWRPVGVPSPGGTSQGADSELFAVRCATASDCWAVGDYRIPGSATVNQALHWTGKRWRSVPVPSPAGTANPNGNLLGDVTCISTSNCWAVGDYFKIRANSAVTWNLVLHWTGKKWFKVAVPNPAGTKSGDGNGLNSVRCTSASDCWAGGEDGTSPEAAFAAARPTARPAVRPASAAKKVVISNEMLHWNGTKWANVKVPNPGGTADLATNVINGLTCTARSDCWAAGTFGTFKDPPNNNLNEALHWTGTKWIKTSVPDPAGTGNDARNQLMPSSASRPATAGPAAPMASPSEATPPSPRCCTGMASSGRRR
jgi:hypothetical protein